MTRAQQIIEAVRSRGSDARDVRDAAHEAHHALVAKVKAGRWDRETIHEALRAHYDRHLAVVAGLVALVAEELDARAVEMLVCRDLDEPYDLEHWTMVCCMETFKTLGVSMEFDWAMEAVRERVGRPRIRSAADVVMALKPWRPRKRVAMKGESNA